MVVNTWEQRPTMYQMAKNDPESFPCAGCGKTLTDETAILDVENNDAPFCEKCFYVFPSGPFFGGYDRTYDKENPTEKQRFCVDCQECCGKCWYLSRHEGCMIYPYRPLYCRGYECRKLKEIFGP
jgi:hypothetical protein